MSSSLRVLAKGAMSGSWRRPSRYLMSCQWVKYAGWPASEGVPGMVAWPSSPWQPAHASALRRPASTSPAEARMLLAAITATSSTRMRVTSLLIADPVDRARVVVGDEQRAVLHLARVHGPSPDLLALQPALGERLVLRHVVGPQRDHHDAEAGLLVAVPGPALGEEDAVLVLGREHRTRVEHHAVAGHVRAGLEQRC